MPAPRGWDERAGLGAMSESNTAPQTGHDYAGDDEVAEVAGIEWKHEENALWIDDWLVADGHHPPYLTLSKHFFNALCRKGASWPGSPSPKTETRVGGAKP